MPVGNDIHPRGHRFVSHEQSTSQFGRHKIGSGGATGTLDLQEQGTGLSQRQTFQSVQLGSQALDGSFFIFLLALFQLSDLRLDRVAGLLLVFIEANLQIVTLFGNR